MVWYVKIFHLKTFQLFCLNDKGDRMCKVLALFTLDYGKFCSFLQLWLILFVAMQNLSGCMCKLVLVYISEEKSGLDTYKILPNWYPNVKLFKVHYVRSTEDETPDKWIVSLVEWQEGGSTISPSLLEPSQLRDTGHNGHMKLKADLSKLDVLRANHIQIAQFPVGVLYTCFP